MSQEPEVSGIGAERQWPFTMTLKRPFDFGSERVTAIEFRRGKMGDLKGMKVEAVPSVDQLLLIASRMSGKPLAMLEKLEDEDGAEVLDVALGFFVRSLPAGTRR